MCSSQAKKNKGEIELFQSFDTTNMIFMYRHRDVSYLSLLSTKKQLKIVTICNNDFNNICHLLMKY